ncbi:MAG: gliding motility protein GldM [Bacteroidetes bacterium]|nr:gliding motility protein GldM [Bacteroidota bacterium]
MINMMYLVLTALLALNVTKEVINAFVTINESVELSKDNIDKKNQTTYEYFKKQMELDAAKYTAVNNQAQNIRKGATDLNKFIDDLKVKLIRTAEKLDEGVPTPKLPDMENKEDYDSPTHIMIGDDDAQGKKGEAVVLRNKLEAYKKLIIANAPKGSEADYQKRMDNLLSTKDPVKKEDGKGTWELVSFYHNPVVATVALLTKFQSDVRNAESQVIDDLLGSVDRNIVKLDKLAAKVIANSTVVTIGSDYQADVFLSATSSTMVPEVFIGATWDSVKHDKIGGSPTALPVEGGYAKYSERPSSEGEKKWNGVIRVQKPDGSYEGYNFSASYVAQKPSSVVAAEKMNVLYIGVDNPMAISVPGVSNNQVFPSIAGAGGSLKPNSAAGGGHFIATVTTVGEAKINVTAEIGGKKMPMGEFKYRVKRVPDPVATISNSKGGPINKSMLAAGTLIPQLENFDFELFFKITGFKMSIFAKGKDLIEYESTGNQLTPQMRDAIAKLRAGDKVFIEYIKAKMATGADQSTRSLSPMAFTIQ